MNEAEVINYIKQVCSGIKHMHENNYVHLDIKVRHQSRLYHLNKSQYIVKGHTPSLIDTHKLVHVSPKRSHNISNQIRLHQVFSPVTEKECFK